MLEFHGKYSLPQGMKILNHCPFCGASAEEMDIKLLKKMMDREIIHVHCAACRGSIIALLMTSGPGVASIGLVTDLSFDDMVKFINNREISLDDVLGMHELLKSPHCLRKMSAK